MAIWPFSGDNIKHSNKRKTREKKYTKRIEFIMKLHKDKLNGRETI